MALRFALDQNFPVPILTALGAWIVEAELSSIRAIDVRLERVDDWKLILALHQRGWDGLVTSDQNMVKLPKELSLLKQINLVLVITESAGHDPLKATGLLLANLPSVIQKVDRTTSQVFKLRAPPIHPEDPSTLLGRIADHRSVSVDHIFRENRLSPTELATDPLQ